MGRAQKLSALRHIAVAMQADGALVPLFAFLAGRLDQVHFVTDLEGANLAIHLSVAPRVWPRVPVRITIDGAAVHHPLAFIERAALRDDDIYVRVDFGVVDPPEWYQDVLEGGVQDPRHYVEAAIQRVRQEIDLALDVYRTASEMMASTNDEDREYLRFALQKAQGDIRALSGRLQAMEEELERIGAAGRAER